jgi:hypothetical protein
MERARLAAPGPADNRDQLAGLNAEAQIVDRLESIAAGIEHFAQIAALDLGHESVRRRTPSEQALLGFCNQPLQREPHEDQDQRPGKNTAHVEQRLLLHHAVTNPGGGAHQLGDNDDAHGKADGNFPGGENTGHNRCKISSRSIWMRVGLNATVISSNSRETPLTASRMLCAKTGNDTANINAKMRVSVPRNQRITISVQDNAGTPMTKFITGIK